MKSKAYLIVLLYLFFTVSGSLYSIGERTITLEAEAIRKMADYSAGLTEMSLIRAKPVLALSSARSSFAGIASPDLVLSFDEGNPVLFRDSIRHYQVSASSLLTAVDAVNARAGSGAAFFSDSPLTLKPHSNAALFAPNNRFYDFSMEFWLNPLKLENGEQIVLWTSSFPVNTSAAFLPQQILCKASKNRLLWSFQNFFFSPDGAKSITIDIGGVSAVVPKTWSHHLIRFDSATGMIEYLVDGKAESIEYATSTRRERGEVYTPITGTGGNFILGNGFLGMMDEFRIYGSHVPGSTVQKYPLRGGRIETKAIDLGEGNNGIVKLEAFGGRTAMGDRRINNEYRQNGRFRFSDDSEMQFFIRTSDNPYRWNSLWQPVTPGADIAGSISGRYVQLAADFYPSADGEASPYLEALRIVYLPDEPPLPPAHLTAVAVDGAVQLHWKNSPNRNVQGYLVYYGTTGDDYFGEDAALGISPINVGKRNEIRIDGLKNGTLYYFRVAAYSAPSHIGDFSREVRARPLRGQ
ncbi:MAG: fibronectin type III domain-containing protein [Treponema sp.]|nr:fibronectin type III domain-containing protein [Treponema sp.]